MKELKLLLQKTFMSIFFKIILILINYFFSQRTGSIVESFVDFQKQLKFKLSVLSHAIKKFEIGIFIYYFFKKLF